jgi:16S rRNA (uracil1498-N3)-methyltransferase
VRTVRVPIADLASGERALDDAASRHLARVLRLKQGDAFVAFDPRAAVEADAEIVAVSGRTVRARIGALRSGHTAASRPVVWLQGIAKGEKLAAIVRDATELGATRIVPFVSRYGVVKVDAKNRETKQTRWERIAREAARQCGRSDAPVVDAPLGFDEALAAVGRDHERILLYERGDEPIGGMLLGALEAAARLAIAAGPEGGFAEDEVARARAAGWRVAWLGDSILRAETVAAAVLGAIRVWSTIRR